MTEQKPRGVQLGRGLSALLGENAVNKPQIEESGIPPQVLPVEFLSPSPYQPRRIFNEENLEELASSIRERGIVQPILVRSNSSEPGRYEIVAGERRWRAAQLAQLHEVPVVVHELTDEGVLEVALVENIQRTDLNPLEEALGYQKLIKEFNHTQESLAKVVGKSRSYVANSLRLLTLPDEVLNLIENGTLSAGHARALVGSMNPSLFAEQIRKSNLNVRQTEALVRKEKAPRQAVPRTLPIKDPDTMELERTVSDNLGLKVKIEFRGENVGGKIVVHYGSLDQLDEVIRRLGQVEKN